MRRIILLQIQLLTIVTLLSFSPLAWAAQSLDEGERIDTVPIRDVLMTKYVLM